MTPSHDGDDELLTAAEAVRRFGIDARQLDLWENTRRLTVVRSMSGRRYPLAQLVVLTEEHRRVEAALRAQDPVPEKPPATPSPTRSRARRRALECLHAADVAGIEPERPADEEAGAYARELVDGVRQNGDEIDAIIASRAEHWSVERMPVVDRNILRLAVFELRFTDVPTGVVVDEAVGLAKLLSTEDSGRFVNGVLGRVARDLRAG